MDRFLIADNPLSGNGHEAIIHTVDPVAIIEVIAGHKHYPPGVYYQHFQDGPEPFTLRLHHFFTTELDSEQHAAVVGKLLSRAWHWYRSYLQFIDALPDHDD